MEMDMIYELKNDCLAVKISSLGAQIISVKGLANGKEYIWDGKEYWQKHAPLLFPVCGSITEPCTYRGREYFLGKHGFISRQEFEALSVGNGELVLVAKETAATLAEYPFAFEFRAIYSLDGTKLKSRYEIRNNSVEVMPYMFGLHPAFALHGEAPKEEFYLDFGKEFTATQYRLIAPFINQCGFPRLIPDGKLYITDEIYNNDTIVLEGTKKSIDFISPAGRVFEMSWSDNFDILCVWKWYDDGARFICIEPWTNIPSDGKVTDDLEVKSMRRLDAGACDEYSYTVDFCL